MKQRLLKNIQQLSTSRINLVNCVLDILINSQKIAYLVLGLVLLVPTNTMHTCPTCIGKLEKKTPPFYSSEYETYVMQHDAAHDQADTINAGMSPQGMRTPTSPEGES